MKAISSWLLRLIGCLVLLLFGAMGSMPLVAVEQRECGYDAQEQVWKIGGKIHFEEEDGIHYLGLITINKKTIDFLKAIFPISKEKEKCESNAKVLIEKDSQGQCVIRHYEEKRNPGVGEEMHATLLYTSKRIQNGHETLKDIYQNLQEIDSSLPHDHAPTVHQIAKAYSKIINPDLEFLISDVVFIKGSGGNVIVAKLLVNDKDEILNEKGHSVSGGFLHISLVNVQPSMLLTSEDEDKINQVVLLLNAALSGKYVKIACKNGCADLEFGASGSSLKDRVRP